MLHVGHVLAAPAPESLQLTVETVDSPIGPLRLVTSPVGLCALDFAGPIDEAPLRKRFPGASLIAPSAPTVAGAQVREYFAGARQDFELSVDLRGLPPFQQQVLQALLAIPRGRTCTYGDLARAVGKPGAARAVGGAMSRNPVPVVIACHRVLATGGGLGGYTGGLDCKRFLLNWEGVDLDAFT
jgi:O-6-methylguanine DNA methyltransferase